jgi:hypothetical protein
MADILRLYSQGRAKTPTQLWSNEENEAVHLLAKERHLARTTAAEFVRNGILTLEDYDKAAEKGFEPTKLEDAHKAAEAELEKKGKEAAKDGEKKKK